VTWPGAPSLLARSRNAERRAPNGFAAQLRQRNRLQGSEALFTATSAASEPRERSAAARERAGAGVRGPQPLDKKDRAPCRTRNRSRRAERVAALPDGPQGVLTNRRLVARPAGLEPATSWFVAVNDFVDPAQLTTQRTPKRRTTWTQPWTQSEAHNRTHDGWWVYVARSGGPAPRRPCQIASTLTSSGPGT
jgi:hypothetical protein